MHRGEPMSGLDLTGGEPTSTHRERISFRFIRMDCCGQQLCWVNPRLPTYCPECGKSCYPHVKSWVLSRDDNAHLIYLA